MVFRPYPQFIQRFFNTNWFGPPPRVTGGSACSWIDHRASGLPRATRRALRTRFRFGSAIRLNLAARGNSQAHYAKGMRSPTRGSHSLGAHDFRVFSLPSKGFFSPFPHGTCALSVDGRYLALWNGLHGFGRGFTCPALLGMPLRGEEASRTGLSPSAARLSRRFRSRSSASNDGAPLPHAVNRMVWAPPRSLAATGGISFDVLSSGY